MAKTKKQLTRKEFLASAAVAAGAAALAACAPTPAPTQAPAAPTAAPTAAPAKPKEKPKIVVWPSQTYTQEADAKFEELIRGWCEKNGVDVEINRLTGDEKQPKWQAAFEAKKFPDIGHAMENDVPKFIQAKVCLETTEVIKRLDKLAGGYTQGAKLAGMTPDGKWWTVPAWSSTEIFYVRKDKLAEKNLPLPDTWEDVAKVAKEITVPGKFWGFGAQIGTPSWDSEVQFSATLWAYGGKTWDENGKVAIDSPETRKVLDYWRDLWKSGAIPPDAVTWDDSGNNKAYQTGIVGMVYNTGSILRYLQTNDKDLFEKTAFIPIPKGPAGRFCSGYYYQWIPFKTTKYPDICLALLEYLMAPDQLRQVYELAGGNMMPVYKDMVKDPMWQDPARKVLADMLQYTVPQGYPGSTTPWCLDAWMDHTMVKMLNRVLVDGWDNDRAIAETKAVLQKWYDDWQKKLSA